MLSAPAEKRGACVIMCSPGVGLFDDLNLQPCPVDRECRSTGCGTMCYLKQGSDTGTTYVVAVFLALLIFQTRFPGDYTFVATNKGEIQSRHPALGVM